MPNALAENRSFAPPERAATYREQAEAIVRCVAMARTEDERLEYFKLAKAWITLAEGAAQGLQADQSRAGDS
jgi:hypothetical protein